jgi:hypothetical protein
MSAVRSTTATRESSTPSTLPDNAQLRAHAHAAIARHSRRGWRINKVQRSDNIDAVIAMCMALEAAENKSAELEVLGWL